MPIRLRAGLFEDLPRRAVAHAYDVQAAADAVDSLSSDVVDGVYAGIPVGSYFPYACSRDWQDCAKAAPRRC